jgi:hypothetical protein
LLREQGLAHWLPGQLGRLRAVLLAFLLGRRLRKPRNSFNTLPEAAQRCPRGFALLVWLRHVITVHIDACGDTTWPFFKPKLI